MDNAFISFFEKKLPGCGYNAGLNLCFFVKAYKSGTFSLIAPGIFFLRLQEKML